MTVMRTILRLFGPVVLLAATASCGDVVRDGRAPVFLVIDSLTGAQGGGTKSGTFSGTLTSDVITNVTSPAPCTTQAPCPTIFNDLGRVTLRLSPKDTTNLASPTTNNQVTITRYHVIYRRADGRSTPGVDVPYAFDGAVTGTVPFNGFVTLTFELVRHIAKEESPLIQLMSSAVVLSTIAEVTFYGTDQVGNAISVTGLMTIDFGNFGD
jgi:hypothetical protein